MGVLNVQRYNKHSPSPNNDVIPVNVYDNRT